MGRITCFLIVALLVTTQSPSTAAGTPEQSLANLLSWVIDKFAQEHGGQPPTDWGFLKEYGFNADDVERQFHEPVEKHYLLVKEKRFTENGNRVVAITSRPVKDGEHVHPGRYVIFVDKGKSVIYEWMDEGSVLKMLGQDPGPDLSKMAPTVEIGVSVRNPKGRLLVGEPVCLLVEAKGNALNTPKTMRFHVEVQTPTRKLTMVLAGDELLGFGLREGKVTLNELLDNRMAARFYVVLLTPMAEPESAEWSEQRKNEKWVSLTSEVGDYRVRLIEDSSKVASKEVAFRVVAPEGDEKKASAIFGSADGIQAVLSFGTDHAEVLEGLIKKYPATRFAAYASLIIGCEKMKPSRDPALRDDITNTEYRAAMRKQEERKAVLLPYFERVLSLGFDSPFDAIALANKARCLEAAGRKEDAKEALVELLKKYEKVDELQSFIGSADSIRSDIEALEKEVGSSTDSGSHR